VSDEFQQARKNLEGLEQYLLQFWARELTALGRARSGQSDPPGG